jgi:hypothetical protein
MNITKMIDEVKRLNSNTPSGCIQDADTILCDIMQSADLDFEITGLAEDLFNIYQNSRDKQAVKEMFFLFTDMNFEDYLQKCVENITR